MATSLAGWTTLLVASSTLGVCAGTAGCADGAASGASQYGISGGNRHPADAFLDEPDPSPQPPLPGDQHVVFQELMDRLKAGKPKVI